jgi:hypothetical protein
MTPTNPEPKPEGEAFSVIARDEMLLHERAHRAIAEREEDLAMTKPENSYERGFQRGLAHANFVIAEWWKSRANQPDGAACSGGGR